MAGITLAQAETELASALTALSNARSRQTLTHGNRTTVQHDLKALQQNVDYWNRMAQRLTRGGPAVSRIVLND